MIGNRKILLLSMVLVLSMFVILSLDDAQVDGQISDVMVEEVDHDEVTGSDSDSTTALGAISDDGTEGDIYWYIRGDTLYVQAKPGVSHARMDDFDDHFDIGKDRPNWEFSLDWLDVTKVVIEQSVAHIGDYAFYRDHRVTSVTMYSDLSSIGKAAFKYSCYLTTINIIGDGWNPTIGQNAFCLADYAHDVNHVECRVYSSKYCASGIIEKASNSDTDFDHRSNNDDSGSEGKVNWRIDALYGRLYLTGKTSGAAMKDYDAVKRPSWEYASTWSKVRNVIITDISSIGAYAFHECYDITEVSFDHILESIGTRAFYGCSGLTSFPVVYNLTHSTHVRTIGYEAFAKCTGLHHVIIPNGVEEIGDAAFGGCTGLVYADFYFAVALKVLKNNMFHGCTSLESVTLSHSMEVIEYSAFFGCSSLKKIDNLDDMLEIKAIEDDTFNGCSSLPDFKIPFRVTTIGDRAFKDCVSLTSMIMPERLSSLGSGAFQGCTGLKYVELPDDLAAIEDGTFMDCKSLRTIELPRRLVTLGAGSFQGCSYLKTVELPRLVTTVGADAFKGCSSVTELTFNERVKEIGGGAFQNCFALSEIIYNGSKNNIETVGESAFDLYRGSGPFANCTVYSLNNVLNNAFESAHDYTTVLRYTSLNGDEGDICWNIEDDILYIDKSDSAASGKMNDYSPTNRPSWESHFDWGHVGAVVIGPEVESIGSYAFWNASNITSFDMSGSDSLTSIGDHAFSHVNVRSIMISDKVAVMGAYAFSDNPGLVNLTLYTASSLVRLEEGTFSNCTSLQTVSFPKSLTTIGPRSFEGDVKLANIGFDLAESLTEIMDSAFKGCVALKSFELIETLTTIGPNAFMDDEKLSDIDLFSAKSLKTIGDGAFKNCPSLKIIKIPNTVTAIGKDAFADDQAITTLDMSSATSLSTIGDSAFRNCALKSVTIPAGVVSIGSSAFVGNPLETLDTTLSLSLQTIGESAFRGCDKLTTVPLSVAIQTIGDYAFADCGLTEIRIPGSVTVIGNYAFSGNHNLGILDLSVADHLQIIGEGAFMDDALTGLTIPGSVTTIGSYAFSNNGRIDELDLSHATSLVTIGDHAFQDCDFVKSVTIPGAVETICDYAFANCLLLESFDTSAAESLKTIGSYAFTGCSRLGSVTIPKSVVDIRDHAFTGIKLTVYFYTDGALQTIGDYAFSDCGLEQILIPRHVLTIGSYAFSDNKEMRLLQIASAASLSVIGEGAFQNCESLSIILSMDSPDIKTIGPKAFQGCSSLKTLELPVNVKKIGEHAFQGCNSLEMVLYYGLKSSIVSVGESAFALGDGQSGTVHCRIYSPYNVLDTRFDRSSGSQTELEYRALYGAEGDVFWMIQDGALLLSQDPSATGFSMADFTKTVRPSWEYHYEWDAVQKIVIYPEISRIGNYAFYGIDKSIDLMQDTSLKEIGEGAFAGSNLTSVSIPAEVQTIGSYAFSEAKGLSVVDLSSASSLRTIGDGAFQFCVSLKSIVLPASVSSIGENSFKGCSVLESITLPDSIWRIPDGAFADCAALRFEIPDQIVYIGDSAFMGCKSMTNAILPNGLGHIGSQAFMNDVAFTKAVIPDTVVYIGDMAFGQCSGLTEVVIGDGIEETGVSCFIGCGNIQRLQFPISIDLTAMFDRLTKLTEVDVTAGTGVGVDYSVEALPDMPWTKNAEILRLHEGITYIGDNTFFGLNGIKNVIIPNSVNEIGSGAFHGCESIESVQLGFRMFTIGDEAFEGCVNLSKVVNSSQMKLTMGEDGPGSVTKYASEVVNDLSLTSVDEFAVAYSKTTQECMIISFFSSETKVVLPESMTINGTVFTKIHVASSAFQYSSIVSLDVPANYLSVGEFAFADCDSLKEIRFLGSTEIAPNAFDGCWSLKTIEIAADADVSPYAFPDRIFQISDRDVCGDALAGHKWVSNPDDIFIIASSQFGDDDDEPASFIDAVTNFLKDVVKRVMDLLRRVFIHPSVV